MCVDLTRIVQKDASKLALLDSENASSVALADSKLFIKWRRSLNSEMNISYAYNKNI
jgi:hypothetical protein